MKTFCNALLLAFLSFLCVQCKTETKSESAFSGKNEIVYAKGFSIVNYDGYSIVTVKNPCPKATHTYT